MVEVGFEPVCVTPKPGPLFSNHTHTIGTKKGWGSPEEGPRPSTLDAQCHLQREACPPIPTWGNQAWDSPSLPSALEPLASPVGEAVSVSATAERARGPSPSLSGGLGRRGLGIVGSGSPPPPDWGHSQVSHQDLPFPALRSCPVVRRRVKGEASGRDLSPCTPLPSSSLSGRQDNLAKSLISSWSVLSTNTPFLLPVLLHV